MVAVEQLVTQHLELWTSAIKLKSTAGRGSSNKIELYGIKKLRRLVLELAVRGLLTPKVGNFEDTTLGKIGSWAVGNGFPTSEQGSRSGNILFAKVSDMNNDGNERLIYKTNNTITEEAAKRLRVNIHPAGTVIFPKIGGAIATNKRRILIRPTAIDNNCLGIIPKKGVLTDWLFLLLSSIDFSKYQAGTSVPALAQGVIQDIPVKLPNEADQHRIVAKVEELMTLCDQLEQQTEVSLAGHQVLVETLLISLTNATDCVKFDSAWLSVATHFNTLFTTEQSIDRLKKTILQLAVMGNLIPQDPNDEPASELLKKIATKKAKLAKEGKIKKEKLQKPIGEGEKPFALPKGWMWVRLGQVGICSTGKTPSTREPRFFEGNIPFIGPGQLSLQGELLNPDKFVSEEGLLESTEALQNDILMVCIGGSIGKAVIADKRLAFNQQINSIRPMLLSSKYLFMTLSTDTFYESVIRNSTGSATPIINRSKWEDLLIPLSPELEQQRITTKVEQLIALCDQLKTCLNKAQTTKLQLTDAVIEIGVEQ